ncbi:MAG: hypothetical protein GKR96_04345 [Gammaproteobacteria bacterium]|nr:hypothetical protein [Gammaproteobacteria bacterium]
MRWWIRFGFIALSLIAISSCASSKVSCDAVGSIKSDSTWGVGGLELNQPPKQCFMDGCSLVPDFGFGDCCDTHDIVYWRGGSPRMRQAADRELRQCIREKGNPLLSELYYLGVRVGGVSWLPTPWRWGFGWHYPDSKAR